MKKYFGLLCLCFLSVNCFAAKPTTNGVDAPTFGTVVSGTSTGTLPTSTCTKTGGITALTGCSAGSGTVSATNSTGGTAVNKQSIRIFISPTIAATSTLINTNDITALTATGTNGTNSCTSSTSGGATMLSCNNSTGTSPKIWTITINGTLNVAVNETAPNTTRTYTMTVCSCCSTTSSPDTSCAGPGVGCPTAPTDLRCQGTLGSSTTTGNTAMAARVYKPIGVTAGTAMNFGWVVAGASTGRVTTGGLSDGGVTIAKTSILSPGTFSVLGDANTGTINYSITLGSSTASLTGPGTAMTAELSFVDFASIGGTPNTTPITRSLTSGADNFSIYGRLTVGVNQVKGTYTGTYTVTVNYN